MTSSPTIVGINNLTGISNHYRDHGFVVVDCTSVLPTNTADWTKHTAHEWWDVAETVNSSRLDEFKLERPDDVLAPLRGKARAHIDKRLPPHKTGGWYCEPPSFHTRAAWQVRQHPQIVNVAKSVLNATDVRLGVDRIKMVTPGKGMNEFWHIDGVNETRMQGLFAVTDLVFVCSKVSAQRFRDNYNATKDDPTGYAKTYKGKTQFTFKPDAPDALGICDAANQQEVCVPAGHWLIFDSALPHATRTNKTGKILYGFYLTYQDATMADHQPDRIDSWRTGKMPARYPTGDRTHYLPLKWKNFPKVLANYNAMERPGAQSTHDNEPDPVGYTPPTLTAIGREIMGLPPVVAGAVPPPRKRNRVSDDDDDDDDDVPLAKRQRVSTLPESTSNTSSPATSPSPSDSE